MDKFLKRKTDSDCRTDELQSSAKNTVKKAKVHRLYNDNYLKYGFNWTGDAECPPHFALCVAKYWQMNLWCRLR